MPHAPKAGPSQRGGALLRPTKADVLAQIVATPGKTSEELGRLLGVTGGTTVTLHLAQLEAEKKLRNTGRKRFRRYFPASEA